MKKKLKILIKTKFNKLWHTKKKPKTIKLKMK